MKNFYLPVAALILGATFSGAALAQKADGAELDDACANVAQLSVSTSLPERLTLARTIHSEWLKVLKFHKYGDDLWDAEVWAQMKACDGKARAVLKPAKK
jgi:hypothetical protein